MLYNIFEFCTVSKMGHAEEDNVYARSAGWRSSAMAIKISVLDSSRRVLSCESIFENNGGGYRKLWAAPFKKNR